MHPKDLRIDSFTYELPEAAVAIYPLENRDESKLLIYKNGQIDHFEFKQFPQLVPNEAMLVLNNTKVFHARLFFQKESGSTIEIFCLSPYEPKAHVNNFASKTNCTWECYIGNAKKWKSGVLELNFEFNGNSYVCQAELIKKQTNTYLVKFSWNAPELCFLDLTELLGKLPIPPYLDRDAELIDELRYQTVFAEKTGSVAAPTASLHFTPAVFEALKNKGVDLCQLTLHVGAGTFKPVTASTIEGHEMHHETVEINLDSLQKIAAALQKNQPIICVGTTALRSLESIFWHALNVFENQTAVENLHIEQWTPYQTTTNANALDLVQNLITEMQNANIHAIRGTTGILIAPGYAFRLANALVTNFHQPQSTLLLLIAAIIGDNWKLVYESAIQNQYRFLSYGDSSLLWINH